MNSVMTAAQNAGFPEEARHLEYFSVPEQPDDVNHDFHLKLARRSGKQLLVQADISNRCSTRERTEFAVSANEDYWQSMWNIAILFYRRRSEKTQLFCVKAALHKQMLLSKLISRSSSRSGSGAIVS